MNSDSNEVSTNSPVAFENVENDDEPVSKGKTPIMITREMYGTTNGNEWSQVFHS